MAELLPVFLIVGLESIGFFSFLSVAVWSLARRREREAYYRAEMVKAAAGAQGGAETQALDLLREIEKIDQRRRRESNKLAGLITTVTGFALMFFLQAVVNDRRPIFLAGFIPLVIGIALLVYAYKLAPKPGANS